MIGGIVRLSRRCGWYGECVGSGSDPGEEAEAGPFGELGEDIAGLTVFVTGGDTLGQASRRMGDEPAHEIDCRHVMYDLAGSIGRRSLLVTFSASPVTSTSARLADSQELRTWSSGALEAGWMSGRQHWCHDYATRGAGQLPHYATGLRGLIMGS
jgi:hypothetical protein